MQIVIPTGASYITQSEFNTAIALLACAQNKLGKYVYETIDFNCPFLIICKFYKQRSHWIVCIETKTVKKHG